MNPDAIARELVNALEAVASDLGACNMPPEQYAAIRNRIGVTVGAARDAIDGGPGYCLTYQPAFPNPAFKPTYGA